MSSILTLRAAIARGAWVALANWPLVVIDFLVESLYKLAVSVPVVAGAFMVAVLLGVDVRSLLGDGLIAAADRMVVPLGQRPVALAAFLLALSVVALGGAMIMYVVKGGTLSVLVAGERRAAAGHPGPSRARLLAADSAFSATAVLVGARRFARRSAWLALALGVVYGLVGLAYLLVVTSGYRLTAATVWGQAWPLLVVVATSTGVVAVGAANLLFDLMRVVTVTDDCTLATAFGRLRTFLLADARHVLGIFGVMTLVTIGGTGLAVTATAALALVAWVPWAGLVVLPLQFAFWIVRGLVFQYVNLATMAAYQTQYRRCSGAAAGRGAVAGARRVTDYTAFFSRAGLQMQQSAIRQMGTLLARAPDMISFAPGYPAEDQFPWEALTEMARELLTGADGSVLQYGPTRGDRALRDTTLDIMAGRGIGSHPDRVVITTGSQQGLDLAARVLLDPGDVALMELPSYTGAIAAFRNVGAALVGVRQEADGVDLDALDETLVALRAEGRRVKLLYVVPNFQNPTGLLLPPAKRARLLEWRSAAACC